MQSVLFISVNFIFTFQAGLTVIEVGFEQKPEDDKPEALRMEHFHLPLGMWFVGTLISLLCFIAELITHRMARLEEPRVTQITAESENLGEIEDIEDTKV